MKHIAPGGLRCRTVFTRPDKIALAAIGAMAALAVLSGLLNPQSETTKSVFRTPPSCYSIGTSVAPGCSATPSDTTK
ncbi:protein of unknown function [Bradyrhizobium vignae]|uniref:Uncharacterized protein n=1 Tax=Bradyrhizobium vignae TaxID=1549949 RepID=A0A2U3Q0V2_9BRAD|nr:protein of unknown function [Bradyrhizobium vignae]